MNTLTAIKRTIIAMTFFQYIEYTILIVIMYETREDIYICVYYSTVCVRYSFLCSYPFSVLGFFLQYRIPFFHLLVHFHCRLNVVTTSIFSSCSIIFVLGSQ